MNRLYYLNSVFTSTESYYQKWFEFFEQDLHMLYNIFAKHLNKHSVNYKDYPFNDFCKLIYKRSSKRIPLY